MHVSFIEFPKKMSFSADFNFWIESVWLISVGKESILWRLQKKMSDAKMSLFAVEGYKEEEECKFLLGV